MKGIELPPVEKEDTNGSAKKEVEKVTEAKAPAVTPAPVNN